MLHSKTWVSVSDIILSERSQTQKEDKLHNSIYMKFKTGKSRRWLSLVRAPTRRGQQGTRPQGAENILYVDLGSGYLDVYIYKNSSSFLIEIHVLYCM